MQIRKNLIFVLVIVGLIFAMSSCMDSADESGGHEAKITQSQATNIALDALADRGVIFDGDEITTTANENDADWIVTVQQKQAVLGGDYEVTVGKSSGEATDLKQYQ